MNREHYKDEKVEYAIKSLTNVLKRVVIWLFELNTHVLQNSSVAYQNEKKKRQPTKKKKQISQ